MTAPKVIAPIVRYQVHVHVGLCKTEPIDDGDDVVWYAIRCHARLSSALLGSVGFEGLGPGHIVAGPLLNVRQGQTEGR